jgi:tripartite-type tricarboxylate transporter receptor subunit TctC
MVAAMFFMVAASMIPAFVQILPEQPVRIMVPFPAGGIADLLAHRIGQ